MELLRNGRRQSETLGIERDLYERKGESTIDTINAMLQQRTADMSLREVNVDLKEVHCTLVPAIAAMPDAVLAGSWSSVGPETHETPIIVSRTDDCAEHYDAHRIWIEDLVKDGVQIRAADTGWA